ncbi:MFS transporter [Gluconacetobacter tumulisoli]|uniref:MFS transporter n=1 Tax=Gluconacetobacter tumulisoli TaxID=1286189 RepID=A0A7W4K9E3_9PROT|nr:MFS transporter [Gluconacetobacter tumulisoli]MBB2202767.1 MFS transporter [Gluconacetobacter tumulisoli]
MEHQDSMDRAIRKSLWHVVPVITIMFVLAYLDRANIGFAKQAFQHDTGLSNAAYGFGAGIFFIGYAIFEIPSNILLYRAGARLWLGRIMITWGIVSACMMFAHTAPLFYALRFLLGLSEAGFFPGILLYLTFWFPLEVRARATGYFLVGAPLAFIVGGPISGALLSLEGSAYAFGLHGWQLMFLVEGVLAVLMGIWVLLRLVERPMSAPWLAEDEKTALTQEMEREDARKIEAGPAGISATFLDPRVMFLCVIWFLVQVCGYGIYFFLPVQIATILGTHVGLMVGIVSAVPPVCALAAVLFVPRLSERLAERRTIAALVFMAGAAGIAVSALAAGRPVIAIIALCVAAAGHLGVQPLYWTFPSSYLGGAAAASGLALINAFGNLGGFVAPNIRVWAETEFQSQNAGLYVLAASTFCGALMILALRRFAIDGYTAPRMGAAHRQAGNPAGERAPATPGL